MGFYAMLKCVSLWNQCDIPHSGIVCDITPTGSGDLPPPQTQWYCHTAHQTLLVLL